MKATAIAPINNALTKYWGKKDEMLRIPLNSTISVNLSNMVTTTTVEFSDRYDADTVEVNGKKLTDGETRRVMLHIDRIRTKAKIKQYARIVSTFNFPMSAGLSSSASGFAALTVAGVKAAGLALSEKELTILARQASGSACRSIPDGFVEWIAGNSNETSYARSIFPVDHWNLIDIAVVVSTDKKEVPTTQGQKLVQTSPFMKTRLAWIESKNKRMKQIIKRRDFQKFGELVEEEALELHAIMLTSKPSLIYWTEGTLRLMKLVKKWRSDGLPIYFTVNTGQNIHVLCEEKTVAIVEQQLRSLDFVKQIMVNRISEGARLSEKHLF